MTPMAAAHQPGQEGKSEMRSLEVRQLAREIDSLSGARLEKVFHPALRDLYFQFSQKGEGKVLLRVMPPAGAYLTSEKPAMEAMPRDFCVVLRKHLNNAFFEKAEQLGFDRILSLSFRRGEQLLTVVLELFGRGNVILCDEAGVIIQALTYKSWKDRSIKKGTPYARPPSSHSLPDMDYQEFTGALSSGEEIVRVLAAPLGLGNAYAEEVCLRAGVLKSTRKPSPEQLSLLWEEARALLAAEPAPQLVWRADSAGKRALVDVVLFPLKVYAGLDLIPAESLSAGLEEGFKHTRPATKRDPSIEKRERVNHIITSQEEAIISLAKGVAEDQRKAELLYEHYQDIAALLEEARQALASGGWAEVKERLEKMPGVVQVDIKAKTMTVELPDEA